MNATDFIVQVFAAATSAAIGATIATQLALRSFYAQQMWNAKRKAYEDIMVALHAVRRHLLICLEALGIPHDPTDSFYEEHFKRQRVAWDDIAKSMDLGEYLVSSEAAHILKEMCTYWDSVGTPETFMDSDVLKTRADKIGATLETLKCEARIDLGLQGRGWESEVSN